MSNKISDKVDRFVDGVVSMSGSMNEEQVNNAVSIISETPLSYANINTLTDENVISEKEIRDAAEKRRVDYYNNAGKAILHYVEINENNPESKTSTKEDYENMLEWLGALNHWDHNETILHMNKYVELCSRGKPKDALLI